MMEYTFPGLRGYRVRWSINQTLFHLDPNKVEQIAYMPRKGADDARQVLATLASRGSLADFRIRPIVNLDETGVAACLRESLIFLSLGQHEGFRYRGRSDGMRCDRRWVRRVRRSRVRAPRVRISCP